jgi:cytochrome P450
MAVRTLADLPGPRRLPLVGNALQIRPHELHLLVEEWADRYGPMFRFDIGRRPIVAVGRPETIKSILRARPDEFARSREVREAVGEMRGANGVFAAEGDAWRRQRRLAVTALNAAQLARFFDVIRTANERLHARLTAAADSGGPFDIADAFASYTVDVTAALAFGVDVEHLDGRGDINAHVAEVFATLARRISAPFPYWRWLRLPADRRADRSVAALEGAVAQFVAEARQRMRRRPELETEPENFLEAMLGRQKSEGRDDEAEIFGNVMTMLLAGEDTTSHTLAWATWLLAEHPDAQARLAAEAAANLAAAIVAPNHATADRLQFAEGVVRETLRIKPVAPLIFIEAIGPATVEDVALPADTRLLLHTRHAAMRPEHFVEPEYFLPERWLARRSEARESTAWIPFGAGPRFCPGRNLALLEAKAALATVARSFEVFLDQSGPPVTERFSFTMAPTNLRVVLRRRES